MTAARRAQPVPPQWRTPVGNGNTLWLDKLDQRSPLARRFKEVLRQILTDIGGDPTEAQHQIARRAAAMSVWAESMEARLVCGENINIGLFSTVANAQRRLLETLGLKRIAFDITKSLDAYLTEHAANNDADDDAGEDAQVDSESAEASTIILEGDAS